VTDGQTDGQTDGRTDGQSYDVQDRASIAASRGKNTRQDSQKVTNVLYFTHLGRSLKPPPNRFAPEFARLLLFVLDLIVGAKFQIEIFRGYGFTGDANFRFVFS